jgi:hypothetical protein
VGSNPTRLASDPYCVVDYAAGVDVALPGIGLIGLVVVVVVIIGIALMARR